VFITEIYGSRVKIIYLEGAKLLIFGRYSGVVGLVTKKTEDCVSALSACLYGGIASPRKVRVVHFHTARGCRCTVDRLQWLPVLTSWIWKETGACGIRLLCLSVCHFWWILDLLTQTCWASNASDLYSGSARFETGAGRSLFGFRCFVPFLNSCRQVSEWYFEIRPRPLPVHYSLNTTKTMKTAKLGIKGLVFLYFSSEYSWCWYAQGCFTVLHFMHGVTSVRVFYLQHNWTDFDWIWHSNQNLLERAYTLKFLKEFCFSRWPGFDSQQGWWCVSSASRSELVPEALPQEYSGRSVKLTQIFICYQVTGIHGSTPQLPHTSEWHGA
jgi:hypothetical protein